MASPGMRWVAYPGRVNGRGVAYIDESGLMGQLTEATADIRITAVMAYDRRPQFNRLPERG